MLSIDREWAHLSGVRPVWVDRRAVRAVHAIRSSLPPWHGIWFDSDDGAFDGVPFWTVSAPATLAAFARHGWPLTAPDEPDARR